jgi:hypothetical protein
MRECLFTAKISKISAISGMPAEWEHRYNYNKDMTRTNWENLKQEYGRCPSIGNFFNYLERPIENFEEIKTTICVLAKTIGASGLDYVIEACLVPLNEIEAFASRSRDIGVVPKQRKNTVEVLYQTKLQEQLLDLLSNLSDSFHLIAKYVADRLANQLAFLLNYQTNTSCFTNSGKVVDILETLLCRNVTAQRDIHAALKVALSTEGTSIEIEVKAKMLTYLTNLFNRRK